MFFAGGEMEKTALLGVGDGQKEIYIFVLRKCR